MFHTCRTIDDCNRLYQKLKERLEPPGGQKWMVDLLEQSYKKAVEARKTPTYNYREMLDKILHYASNRKDFDCTFFKSLDDHFKEKGVFTRKQEESIKKVYEKFKLEKK